ncbi:MAG TPA: gfo/Idh/MocA family oxidoreductase, partial [Pirellulaceae bacterium]|nr:gfo/Idh/MocA family oxidoreductase [Pirellulaceae bacterium]
MTPSTDRRKFLKATAGGLVAATVLSSASAAAKGASDRLLVGLIGCGGRGTHDAQLFKSNPNVEIAYVCDCDQQRLALAAKGFGVPAKGVISDM